MDAVRSSPFTAQMQEAMHAELDGMLEKATSAAAPILERIAVQQFGMTSEGDLRELLGALTTPITNSPDLSPRLRDVGTQLVASLLPVGLEEARAAGKLLVDDPAPAAAAAAGRGSDL